MMSKAKKLPSQRLLKRLLRYDPDTGKLYWRRRPVWMFKVSGLGGRAANATRWNNKWAGKEAFSCVDDRGYKLGSVFDQRFWAHRLIYKMHTGKTTEFVDHVNGDRSDNRIRNLRSVTASENSKNITRQAKNTSGCTGVSWSKRSNKWQARIGVGRKQIHLGFFTSKEAAAEVREAANIKYGFHPNYGRDCTKGDQEYAREIDAQNAEG